MIDPYAAAGADEFVADLTGVEERGFAHVPAGWYLAEVAKITSKINSKGNPQWVWAFLITDGEHAGTTITAFTVLTPKAMWKVAEFVAPLGLGQAGGEARFSSERAVGRRCKILLADDDYNDEMRSIVKKVGPHPDGPVDAE